MSMIPNSLWRVKKQKTAMFPFINLEVRQVIPDSLHNDTKHVLIW
jgi:hypothetical protein